MAVRFLDAPTRVKFLDEEPEVIVPPVQEDMPTSDVGPAPEPIISGSLSGSEPLPQGTNEPRAETPTLAQSDPRLQEIMTGVQASQAVLHQFLLPSKLDWRNTLSHPQLDYQARVADAAAAAAAQKAEQIDPMLFGEKFRANLERDRLSERAEPMMAFAEATRPISAEEKKAREVVANEAAFKKWLNDTGQRPGFIGTFLEDTASKFLNMGAGVLELAAPTIGSAPAQAMRNQAQEMGEMASVNTDLSGSLGRGTGTVASLVLGGPTGRASGLTSAVVRGALETHSRVLQETGDRAEADRQALATYSTLALYMLGGAAGAKLGGAMVAKTASPLAKGAAGFAGAAVGNVVPSLIGQGENYNVESATTDALLALFHARETFKGAKAEAAEAAKVELQKRGELPPSATIETSTGAPPKSVEVLSEAPPEAPAGVPPIKGIAISDKTGEIFNRAPIGSEHLKLYSNEAVDARVAKDSDSFDGSFEHVFEDANGNALSRTEAWKAAEANGQIKQEWLDAAAAGRIKPELQSQYLQEVLQKTPAPMESGPVGVEPVAPQLRGAIDPAPVKAFVEAPGLSPVEAARRAKLAKSLDSPAFRTEPLPEVETPPGPNALRPPDKGQAGGIFGGGTRTPKTKPIGGPPSGNKSWLKIEPFYKRAGSEREGASRILQFRQENPIGKTLGRATDKQFDAENELRGRFWKGMSDATSGLSTKQMDAAFTEFSNYVREKENKRPVPSLSPAAQKVADAFGDIAEFSGLLFNARGGKVISPQGYRPMHLMGRDFIPRMYDPQFLKVIRNPNKNVAAFNSYASELAAHNKISVTEAAATLNDLAGGKGKLSSNDFMGNIEIARGARLPESFYDYDMRRVVSRYIDGYAQRMGQIIAYGQRLEGGGRVIQKNLWDLAREEVQGGDKTTSRWLNEAERQSTNETVLSGGALLAGRLQTIASAFLLANPTSTVPRNLLSGLASSAELLGTRRTLMAATRVLSRSAEGLGAREVGVLKEDMSSLLHAEQLTGDSAIDSFLRSTSRTMLKYSGYDASENFVRTTNFLAGAQFARDFAAAAKASPNGRKTRQMAGLIQKMGVKPDDLMAENGEWKTGDNTRKFIRAIVGQQQGGYKFNQVPLWAGTPTGRFFFQFGRWGTQRAQNMWENIFKPALWGSESTINGVKMTVRDFKPLVKMGFGMVALGEAYALIAQGLFGKDRKDESLTEIGAALTQDTKKGLQQLGSRMVNDAIMSGMFGVWSPLVEIPKSLKDQSRMKNPAEPPGGAGIRAAADLVAALRDQGTLTGDDVKQFLQGFIPGPVAVNDVRRNVMDNPKYEAENDQRTLRQATERWMRAGGKDMQRGTGQSRKTENTPIFAGIRDALLVGDIATAKQLEAQYLRQFAGDKREGARDNLRQSVRGRQPFRAGSFTSEPMQKDFYRWAKRNLSKGDLEQVVRVQARYERAARAAKLWGSE